MKRRNFITTLLGLVGSGTVSASYASSQSKSKPLLIQQSKVSGFQYHDGAQLYSEFKLGDTLTLKRAPENTFDKHAVEVHWRNHMIGHIPSNQNAAISQMEAAQKKTPATKTSASTIMAKINLGRGTRLAKKTTLCPIVSDTPARKRMISASAAVIEESRAA